MEDVPTTLDKKSKKNDNKVIPVMEETRDRLKNNMMKVDTYDSYINKKLDQIEELTARVLDLEKQLALRPE